MPMDGMEHTKEMELAKAVRISHKDYLETKIFHEHHE